MSFWSSLPWDSAARRRLAVPVLAGSKWTIDLLAESRPDPVNIVERTARMVAQNDDPQLIFKPAVAIESAWYRFVATIDTDAKTVDPQIFFDFGSGFSEVFSSRLQRVAGGNIYALTVKLPFPALLVRLDPLSSKGDFVVTAFTAERLSRSKLGRDLAWYAVQVMLADPRGFPGRLPTYLGALNKPYFLRLADVDKKGGNAAGSYRKWIERRDFKLDRDGQKMRAAVADLAERPLISVVMPVYNTPERLLRAAIDSVRGQIYGNWQLCIADDCSTKPHVRRVLSAYAARDQRIRVTFRERNGHIAHATNSAFELADGAWVALLDHDDILRPHALAEVALEIAAHPDAELIYSDEDKLDAWGNRYDPYFKPDFSRELFRSQNYLNHLTVHRAANIRAAGGWRSGFEGSQDYDLNLRIFERIDPGKIRHIPKILYHWRAVAGSTAASSGEKSYAYGAGLRALEEHVTRMRLPAKVEPAPGTPFYRMRFSVPAPAPLVSLIIPTRDRVELLQGCVGSILEKTDYAPYEIIIVDNGSVEKRTHAYFKALRSHGNVRVLRYDKPFNYSAINNFAVSKAKGSIVGLVNNDIEVISPGWLTEMVSWAAQDDVGCVGAKLYYANDTIQHAGVILGIGGVANHAHLNLPRNSPGYFGRAVVLQNYSAVTAACLIVRKSVYRQVGGLDAENLAVAFNDVDLSLKVRDAGYLNVWTPYAELYHLESASRGKDESAEKRERFAREVDHMMARWKDELAADPFYSVHHSRRISDFFVFA